ncbi:MAG: hypothetical protein CMK98_06815 [Pseudomonas sp.]|nr:hypothetical protein [Pseudomonas sp.]
MDSNMPTIEQLRNDIGDGYTNHLIDRLHKFAYIPDKILGELAEQALNENWGRNLHVLKKYLAVHIAWSIEQGKVTFSEDQFYLAAGNLQTRYGTPLYLVFVQGEPGRSPWKLIKAGSHINAPSLPAPPDIPKGPNVPKGVEIVMQHDHMLKDNEDRVSFLKNAPPVAQMCAISGAIQWSLNRELQLPYWYHGKMNYLVPLYLKDRENIANAPDLVAPIQVMEEMLLVRTVLEPHMPYANSRVSVKRHDQLPPWMIHTWNVHADETELDD